MNQIPKPAQAKSTSRRTVLKVAGGVAAFGVLGGGSYLLGTLANQNGLVGPQQQAGKTGQPEVLRSKKGLLEVDLVAAQTIVEIDGVQVSALSYNGSVPGPTLIVNPGDKIVVNFQNKLGASTNLHMHGLHVSPEGNSDNVMLEIRNGETFRYEYQIGADHPLSTNWYHPHLHGAAADQLFAGLYGTVIIEPTMAQDGLESRVLVISDIDFDDNGNLWQPGMMSVMMGREGSRILVNGQVQPTLDLPKNNTERWHIVNACSSRYLHLHWSGVTLTAEAMDSGFGLAQTEIDELVLAPGNRAQMLALVGESSGSILFDSVAHPDMMASPVKGQVLANLNVIAAEPYPAPSQSVILQPTRDIRDKKADVKRKFVLAMPGMGSMNHNMGGGMQGMFTINGESFDMNKVNTRASLNTIEEWTLTNTSGMNHPFHLHVWPMQIVSINGVAVNDVRWRDVVNVPYLGEVVVRIAFERITGKTMYHCHILDHEDLGMMGQIQVL